VLPHRVSILWHINIGAAKFKISMKKGHFSNGAGQQNYCRRLW